MPAAYVYTPAIWLPLVAAAFLAAIGLYAWSRRDVPGGKPFLAMSALTVPILLGIAFEAAAVAPATKLAWQKLQFILLFAGVIPVTCLVLDYAYPGRWLTRRNLALLFIPFLLCLFLAVIDDSRLIWRPLEVGADGKVALHFAPAGAVLTAYGIGMFALNAGVFLRLFVRSRQHRWPVALMLAAQVASRTAFVLDIAHPPALSAFDLTVFVVFGPWTAYAIALFGFRMLDPLPAANRAVIEQMYAGVVVFDAAWRVASLNPAAERILGIARGAARGRTWEQLMPQCELQFARAEASTDPAGGATELPEVVFGAGGAARHYTPALSPLRDFRGPLMGHLLMLHDVTDERRAQAQVLEQQRSLAMLREREQLGRELHDGIAQVLSFASLKLGAIRKLLADNRAAKADEQLAHLESVVGEAHADVREYILDLRTAPTGDKRFFAAFQQFVDGYRQNYGLQVDVFIGAGVDDSILPPEAQVQLFRILQEGFANARKHAQTDRVRASFALEGGRLDMRIEDSGQGFDPRQPAGVGQNHFGLRIMRERAEQLGGSLLVYSAPGQGTCVQVIVPVRDAAGTRRDGDTARGR